MEKLTKEKIDEIKQDAADNWRNDISLAVAAHVHGAGVVRRCGGVVPGFADKKLLGHLKGQITQASKKKK